MSNDVRIAIGIDVGGTAIKLGSIDGVGTIRASETLATHAERGPENAVTAIAEAVARLVSETGLGLDAVAGVGIGAPGPADYSKGMLCSPANLPGWDDFPLRDRIAERLGLSTAFDNDANLAALGEWWTGAGCDVDNLVMLTLGTGVGSGIILNGKVFRGFHENGAELGHMIVAQDGRACGCGQRGCLESYGSANAAAEMAREAARKHPGSYLQRTLERGAELTAEDLVEAVRSGDEAAGDVWDCVCKSLAVACVNIQHVLNVELILLGGGMADAGAILLDSVRGHFAEQSWTLAKDQPRIELAKLGNDAGIVGGAKLAFDTKGLGTGTNLEH